TDVKGYNVSLATTAQNVGSDQVGVIQRCWAMSRGSVDSVSEAVETIRSASDNGVCAAGGPQAIFRPNVSCGDVDRHSGAGEQTLNCRRRQHIGCITTPNCARKGDLVSHGREASDAHRAMRLGKVAASSDD